MKWILNPNAAPPGPFPEPLSAIIGADAHREARAEIETWRGYRASPLLSANRLASRLGLGSVFVKDESGRFGLGSFKALGGAYGVRHVTKGRGAGQGLGGGGEPAPITVTCASDGNHGRAVAWGARMFGCDAVIYLPTHVTEARADAIRAFGARVVRVDGEYDDAVAQADRDARRNGWTVISDTSYEGYMEIPRVVMVGYTVMVEEALEDLGGYRPIPEHGSPTHQYDPPTHRDDPPTHRVPPPARSREVPGPASPTHVFIQGGVGGLAAAVIGHLWARLGPDRPVAVIVEPEEADGLLRSARAGKPVPSRGDLDTIMAGLSCRDVSPLAWEVVGVGAHAFMTVCDEGVPGLMRAAARGELCGGAALGEGRVPGQGRAPGQGRGEGRRAPHGLPFQGGESGVGGLLGLIEVARDGERRREIGLDERSRVLVFNTEGATDPGRYARIVQGGAQR